ncbi:oxidoreductase [Serratia marcescens]|uniref:oxidoreductase n=1 Tax=Serratia marcescens TaxID=615 RepID=UPI000446770A|nr:oxidoreductase [Serratia marcescens]AVN35421.1 oxidoreductase [Serratia marcescens]AVN48753.1 oxidoreductase [Serratia marcescens]EZQ69980.1 hypothetical protein AF53_02866 [Serratia marcescens BIDMC 80]RLO42247.1 oxidoreductase [Serratia marcescens]HEJ8007810.1 oxidoreductase [Serratia marcescens]
MHKLKSLSILFIIAVFYSASTFAKIGDLYIDGDIANKNHNDGYLLTADNFNKLKKSHIKTTTSWTEPGHVVDFEGVKFKELITLVGARGKTLRMRALNDYWVDIPFSDVEKYDILLANKMDENPLRLRNFGPYFVIYPLDQFYDQLNSPTYQARHIWQVASITVIDK